MQGQFICEFCGESFYSRDRHENRRARFCSPSCGSRSKTRTPVERFWRWVNKDGPTQLHTPFLGPCWVWTGYRTRRQGYGKLTVKGAHPRQLSTHRLSWEMHYGAIPPDLCVLHRCDNPPCVRPDHLFLGTRVDNAADRDAKGRATGPIAPRRGEGSHLSRLTSVEVMEIRRRFAGGESTTSLARAFSRGESTILHVVNRRTWKHV